MNNIKKYPVTYTLLALCILTKMDPVKRTR